MKKLILSLFIIFATLNGFSTIYYWVGGSAATLGSSTSLSTIGVGGAATGSTVTFTSADVVIFDGSDISSTAGLQTGTITLTAPSGATVNFGQIKFQNGATITMALGGTRTWNINGLAGSDDFIIPSGCSFTTTGSTYTIAVLTGATALVNGTFTLGNNNNPHIITAADAGSVVFGSGAVFTQGTSSGGAFGTSGTTGGVVFNSGATFIHLTGANPFQTAGGLVIFNSGSLYKITGASIAPSMSGRTYGNIEYAGSGTSTSSGGSALSFENLTVTTGTANINMTGGVNIKGNISVASGSTLTFTPASSSTYTFNGTTAQTISKSGTLTFAANANVVIANTTSTVSVNSAQTFSGSMTVNSGATLIANNATVTLSGTPAINGTFQINQGGFATGGTWTYGSNGTLAYNLTSGTYGPIDAGHTYWPTTSSGPANVTVNCTGGATLNITVARTVPASGTTGTFTLVSGTNAIGGTAALVLNGTTQINGGNFQTTPTYGSSSTLVYNTTYGTSNEWTGGATSSVAAGSGVPANVQVLSGTLTLGGGRGVPGNVTVTAGGLVLNATSGDLYLGGNLTHSGTTWINNGRAVRFVGTGTSVINTSANSGVQFFDYFLVEKSAGTVQIGSTTNVTLNTTTGSVLQFLNAGTLDLNGRTLTLNNSGGNILADGTSGGTSKSIISSTGTGTIAITNNKTASGTASGTLTTDANVTWLLTGGMNYGGVTTVNGKLQIDPSGFVTTNAPAYGTGSTLIYNSATTYGRGTEWSATSGNGYPYHVQVQGGTTVDLSNGGSANRAIAGNLNLGVDGGSTAGSLTMSTMSNSLTVGGNIVIGGNTAGGTSSLTLGSNVGGDVYLSGNWDTKTNGSYSSATRAVFFQGAGTSTVTTIGAATFDYLFVNKTSGGTVNLANNMTVNNNLTLNAQIVTNAFKVIIPNGSGVTANAGGWVRGNLQKNVATGAPSRTFEIGDATNYTPVEINFASVSTAGDLTANTTGSEQPNIGTSYLDNTKSVNRYWSLTNSGIVFTNYNATFNFVAGDIDGGASTSAFSVGKYTGGTWTYPTVGTLAVNYSIITGVTSFSDFAIAERGTHDWTGASNTVWNNAANWGGGVPASGKNIDIPTGLSNYPVLDISPTVTNVNLGSGATVSINGQTLTINGAVSGSGTITGSSSSNLVIGGTAGTIQFTSGSTNNYLKDLIVNASSSMTIGSNSLNITGGATPGTVTVNGTLNTGGYLVLKSNSSGTARVGNSSGTISGLVTVERHIPARRAWRLLAPPITSSGAPTINASWQEGQTQTSPSPALDNNPGFGTHVTGGVTGDGFDQSPSNGSSIKYLSGGSWTNVGATNTGAITDQLAYMLFVRGSRAIDLSAGIAATPDETVLRVKGNIKQGPQTLPLAATGFNLVVNPYPSAIDMHSIALANSGLINDNFKIWDPKIGGSNNVGGYVTVSRNGGNYDYAPDSRPSMSGTGSELSQYIQSGSAFFVDAISTGDVNVVESNKSASGSDNVNNPTTPDERMRVNLRSVNADATTPVVDGVLATYDAANTNAINGNDAGKLANFSTENLGMMRDGKELSIERREIIGTRDTIFLNMANMKQKNYQMEMTAQLLNHPNLLGYLEDSYLSTSTLLNLDGNTIYPFNVNATPASAAANRFMIVFKPNVPLPVTFTSIKAVQQANDIAVEWKVENQTNIKQYEVEKSTDGRSFTNVGTQMATGANGTAATYNWLDVHAVSGDNFYRVKSLGFSGDVQYTRIVKVRMGKGVPAITVYPNPVTDRIVTVQFTDMAKGNYTLNLVNNLGQTVQSKLISHTGANAAQSFAIDRGVAKGNYQLQVVKPGGEKEVMKLVIAE